MVWTGTTHRNSTDASLCTLPRNATVGHGVAGAVVGRRLLVAIRLGCLDGCLDGTRPDVVHCRRRGPRPPPLSRDRQRGGNQRATPRCQSVLPCVALCQWISRRSIGRSIGKTTRRVALAGQPTSSHRCRTARRSVVTEPTTRCRRCVPRAAHGPERRTPAARRPDRERARQRRSHSVRPARAARAPLQSRPSVPWE